MSTETRSKDTKSSLAHRAQQKYNAGKFSEAVDALEELSSEVGSQRDLQIQHNLVLSNFVARKTSAKDFEQNLRNLLYSTNSLASDENGGKGESGRAIAFLRYNLAAALFSQKQYGAAAAVLETLFRRLGALDERVAMHVCFLFLDVILHSNRGGITTERERHSSLRKAQSILSYLEKPHSFNGQHGASEATGGYAAAVTGGAAPELSEADRARKEAQHLEVIEFRFRLHLYKAKLVLLQGQLKTAKKEVKSALEIFQKEIKSKGMQDEKLGENGMSLAIHSCDKSSTGLGQPPLGVQNSTALFLKANLEYLRKNYKKCVKLLASCTLQAVDESVFLNNMGCIHFQMGQRKAAHSYFSRALQATYRSASASASAGVSVSCSTQAEVLYNNGVQLLVQGQLSLAFRCFHSASKFFFNRPKLWLRLGECCTAAFAQQQRQSASAGYRSGLIKGVVGFGCHRRVLLSTSRPVSASQDIDLPEPTGRPHRGTNGHAADGTPKMNLPFAAKCFKNVILLCHQLLESKETTNGSSTPNGTASDKLKDDAAVDAIRQKALVNLAYVYLSMYEPQLALSTANDLLALPSISKTHRFLARSYAAEALCMLSRAMEATRVLQSERELMELAGDYAQESGVQLSRARAGVHVNNATTLLLQSRVSEAEESVTRAVRENPSCRESLELLVYVLLKKGDTKKALRVLKEAQVAQ